MAGFLEMLVIVPVSLANACAFHRFAHRIDLRKAHFAGAGIFAFFAADTLLAMATEVSSWGTVVETIADVVVGGVARRSLLGWSPRLWPKAAYPRP